MYKIHSFIGLVNPMEECLFMTDFEFQIDNFMCAILRRDYLIKHLVQNQLEANEQLTFFN